MKKWIFFLGILVSTPVFASVELVQIATFDWDEEKEVLSPISLGSGTAIEPNLVLTNAHVIRDKEGNPADLVLLCPGKNKRTMSVECNVVAGVIAEHPQFDAALVKTLSSGVYLPQVNPTQQISLPGERIRVYGFPVPVDGLTNFGGTETLQHLQDWAKKGGVLQTEGDQMTITRGKISRVGRLKMNDEDRGIYYLTNVKVNYGNSGGAAFDENKNFVGIPTMRDKEFNALILAYPQLESWITEHREDKPKVISQAVEAYESSTHQTFKRKNSTKISSSSLRNTAVRNYRRPRYTQTSQKTRQDSLNNIQRRYLRSSGRRRIVNQQSIKTKEEKRRSQRGSYRALR